MRFVVATLYQEADLVDEAVRHYRRAGAIARAGNDEQLVAAVHRYMTLAQAQQVRRARAAGRLDGEQLKQALAALGSAQQLAAALTVDDTGLQSNLRLGEMLRLSGQYAQAAAVFGRTVEPAARAGMTWEATIARADHAVCLAHAGHLEAAAREGELAEAELAPHFDDYSRAVVHDALAELAGLLGRPQQQARHAQTARRAWQAHAAYCAPLREPLLAQGPFGPAAHAAPFLRRVRAGRGSAAGWPQAAAVYPQASRPLRPPSRKHPCPKSALCLPTPPCARTTASGRAACRAASSRQRLRCGSTSRCRPRATRTSRPTCSSAGP